MFFKIDLSKKLCSELIILILIRYLYLFLTVNILKDLWYIGSGKYGINFNIYKDILASIVFVFMTVYFCEKMGKNKSSFISMLLNILYVIYFIPLNTSFSVNNMSIAYFISSHVYLFLILYLLSSARFNKNTYKAKSKNFSDNRCLRLIFLILCIMFIIYKISYNGLSFNLTTNSDLIYSNRAEYADYLQSMSGLFISYFISILQNLISYVAPVYLLISLEKKRIIPIIVSVICILSIFSVSSSKNTIFIMIVVFVIYILYKYCDTININKIFNIGVLIFLSICLFLYFTGNTTLYILIIRRIMYVPAWLNTIYFDYFLSASPVLWSSDTFILQNIIPSSYDQSVLNIINNIYFNGKVPSPNTGMFAEAIMHFHYIGVVVYPFLIYVLCKVSDYIYNNYSEPIKLIVVIKLVVQMTNIPIVRTDFILSYVLFTGLLFIIPLFSGKLNRQEVKNA